MKTLIRLPAMMCLVHHLYPFSLTQKLLIVHPGNTIAFVFPLCIDAVLVVGMDPAGGQPGPAAGRQLAKQWLGGQMQGLQLD